MDEANGWLPIEELILDGRPVIMCSAVGPFVAPASKAEPLPREVRVKLYQQFGEWPQEKFNPGFYMELPPNPYGGDYS